MEWVSEYAARAYTTPDSDVVSGRIDYYTVVSFMTHDCSRKNTSASWVLRFIIIIISHA